MSFVEVRFSSLGTLHDWREDLTLEEINETLEIVDVYTQAEETNTLNKVFTKQTAKSIKEWMVKNKEALPLFEKRGRKLYQDYIFTLDLMSQPISKTKYSH